MMKTKNKKREISLSHEDEIIIHCCRIVLDAGNVSSLKQLLNDELNWDTLIERAGWQRLSPLLSCHLLSPELLPSIPGPIQKKLQNISFVSLTRNMLLQNELSRVLTELNKEQIPVIVLKGAALLGDVYSDISLRPMSDLDILVEPDYLDRAEKVAFQCGYEWMSQRADPEHFKTIGMRHLPNLVNRNKGVMLEIHQNIVNEDSPYFYSLTDFWRKSRPITILNSKAQVFSNEDMIIHLGINFLLDRRYRSNSALGQLVDISETILHYRETIDWHLLEENAKKFHFKSGLHCVLFSCNQLMDTPIPSSVLHSLQPSNFDPHLMNLFIARRIIDPRPWLAHDLVNHNLPYNRRRMILSILKRIVNIPVEIIKNDGLGKRSVNMLWIRTKNVSSNLSMALLRPSALNDDLVLDRWLHDTYRLDVDQKMD
jgi:hypothetical protein